MNPILVRVTIEKLTGARPGEAQKTILSFLALFFLLVSYYLVKPLRNSAFHSSFPPDYEQLVFLVSVFLSLGITQIFNYFFDRIDMHRLLRYTYSIVILLKLIFFILLAIEPKWPVVLFYFFASAYFLLCIAVTWGAINFLFNPEQSKRCFGFIAAGTMLGSTTGTLLTDFILEFNHQYEWGSENLLLVSSAFLSMAMLCAHFSKAGVQRWVPHEKSPSGLSQIRLIREIRELVDHKYIRCIGIMVFSLAVANTVMNFEIQNVRDRSICKNTFMDAYSSWLPANLELKEEAFERVYRAKLTSNPLKTQDLQGLLNDPEGFKEADFMSLYEEYNRQLGLNYTRFWNDINKWVSILGLSFLILFSRFIFRFLGVRFAALILPLFFFAASIYLFSMPDIFGIQMILILAGSLNYSLNNVTKEVFYTPTSPKAKGQFKPIIEGPIMRLGDFLAALISILCLSILPATLQSFVYVGFGLVVILVWIGAVWYAGTMYRQAEASQGPEFKIL